MNSFREAFNLRRNLRELTTPPEFHEPVVDGVRAIAVTWVLLVHLVLYHIDIYKQETFAIFNNQFLHVIARGDLGVDLFFVISGYLIGSLLLNEYKKSQSIGLKRFYVRRFLRLIPVYMIVMILGVYFMHGFNVRNAWANLIYVNNFLPMTKQYMPWCWSLAIEEQFYLILPAFVLLVMRLRSGRMKLLAGLLVLAGVIRWWIIRSHGLVAPFIDMPGSASWVSRFSIEYQNLYTRYGALLVGVIGAYAMVFHKPEVQKFFSRKSLINTIGVVSLVIMVVIGLTSLGLPASLTSITPPRFFDGIFNDLPPVLRQLWHTEHRDLFAMCAMFLILAGLTSPSLLGAGIRRALSARILYPVAQLSYSLYLIHEMLLGWLYPKVAGHLSGILSPYPTIMVDCTIGLAVMFTCATVLYLLVEKPSMHLRSTPFIRRITAANRHYTVTGKYVTGD